MKIIQKLPQSPHPASPNVNAMHNDKRIIKLLTKLQPLFSFHRFFHQCPFSIPGSIPGSHITFGCHFFLVHSLIRSFDCLQGRLVDRVGAEIIPLLHMKKAGSFPLSHARVFPFQFFVFSQRVSLDSPSSFSIFHKVDLNLPNGILLFFFFLSSLKLSLPAKTSTWSWKEVFVENRFMYAEPVPGEILRRFAKCNELKWALRKPILICKKHGSKAPYVYPSSPISRKVLRSLAPSPTQTLTSQCIFSP